MHPPVRLLSRELSSTVSRSLYVCNTCRHEAHPRPLVAHQIRRNTSLTERIRRRIWGTENPPGLKDPYGGKGFFEQKWGDEEKSQVEEQQAEEEEELENYDGDLAPPDDYAAASTWDGLERVGHLNKWWNKPSTAEDKYTPFIRKGLSKGGKVRAARQAAAEIGMLRMLRLPLASVCNVTEHDPAVLRLLLECKFRPDSPKQWASAISFPDKEAEEALVYVFRQIGNLGEAEKSAESGATEPKTAKKSRPNDPRHQLGKSVKVMNLSLEDPAVKFAFIKRFSQLIGHRVPDPAVSSFFTVGDILWYMTSTLKPKPKNLATKLSGDRTLQQLPNVKVFTQRQKPGDIDQEFGRRKVMEAVLRERGLIRDSA